MEATTEVEVPKGSKRGQYGMGNIYKHRRNWWLDVRVKGKRHRRKLRLVNCLEKREARTIADQVISEILTQPANKEKGQMPFCKYAEKFARHYTQTDPRKSWKKYAGLPAEDTPLRQCVQFFGDVPLKKITCETVEAFRAAVGEKTKGKYPRKRFSVTTVNKNISLLRALFYRAIATGDADLNPVAALPKGKKLRKEMPTAGRILEEDEQPKLLEQLPGWLLLMAIFCLQTATRRGDLVKLTWKPVHPQYVEFLETKECKKRIIQLNRDARAVLDMLKPEKPAPEAFVFQPEVPRTALECQIEGYWNRAVNRSGLPHIRFHDLRHTAGTRMVEAGVDLETVRKLMGHASLTTTQRYLHSNDQQQRRAVDTLAGSFGRYLPTAPDVVVADEVVTATIH